jgi:hypothetical protein
MKNTTERIMELGPRHRGDFAFLTELHHNNPFSGQFWMACIDNNPGGSMPNFNPTEHDELIQKLHAACGVEDCTP